MFYQQGNLNKLERFHVINCFKAIAVYLRISSHSLDGEPNTLNVSKRISG